MNKAKEVLERLYDLKNKKQSSGMNVFDEIQQIMELAEPALDELYEYENEVERQYQQDRLVYELKEAVEQGDAA